VWQSLYQTRSGVSVLLEAEAGSMDCVVEIVDSVDPRVLELLKINSN
jgi:hypothetical protein